MIRPGRAVVAALVAAALFPTVARAQTVRTDFYVTNGQVNAQVLRDGTLYVGGSFSQVGAVTGAGLPVDATTGVAVAGFPRVTGTVLAAVSDGAGGWYIGGLFTSVDGFARSNLAHVLADLSVSPWNPGANGTVRALLLSGSQLYAGGDFTTLDGFTRNRIGAIDASTGAVAAWNPNANSTVRAMAIGGSSLYVGGQFTNIGGLSRNRIAQLDLTTGAANAGWNPNSNSQVFALQIVGTTLYVGGQFTSIASQTRNRIAALTLATGVPTTWNPNANNLVLTLVASGGTVYLGGQFTSVGGQPRNRIAAIDASSGLATSWNPNAGNLVQAVALDGGTLYAGGDFLSIGGQPRSRVAALSTATGLPTPWDPSAYNTVNVLVPDGAQVFVGGAFTAIGGVMRGNLAAFDLASGAVTAWNPNANNQVQALLATPDALYAGGNFSLVGGRIRNNIAALDLTNGNATPWDPNANGQVSALAQSGGVVYAGGLFSDIGGQSRLNLAALDAATGNATSWNPGADDQVFAIEATANRIYVGGNFAQAGGLARSFLAALDPATGAASGWSPNPNGTVRAIVATCDRLYAGGFFSIIGGLGRNRLAELDLAAGLPSAWNPDANGPVFALARGAGVVYVGGVLSTVGGVPRSRAAAIDPQTGAVTSWNPAPNGTVRALTVGNGEVVLGGTFTALGTEASGNLAAVATDASNPCPAIAISPTSLAAGVVGAPYAQSSAASGGAGSYCWSLTAGALPPGLGLNASSGQISGTPAAAGVYVFSLTATDQHGCAGTIGHTLTVTPAAAITSVVPQGAGLCLNPAQACVSLPFALVRGESAPLRAVSVTFQIQAARLALCSPGPAALSVHAGNWAAAFPNLAFQVLDNGAGSYTVDQVVLGQPCGVTGGGTLFTVDLKSLGYDGTASVTVTEAIARDCDNNPVAITMGAAAAINGSTSPIALLPASLPAATASVPYSQSLSTSTGTPPLAYAVTAGALPPGLTLTSGGLLSGTPVQTGTFPFTVTATDANGCKGSGAYSISVGCPAIAVVPGVLPDGAIGIAYSQALSASAGVAPFSFSVSAGALPPGLTLTTAGLLSGTPTTAGPSVFRITATDAAGCASPPAYYVVDIFATPPVSSVAANPGPLCISAANPCVTVPVDFTRGESVPARGLKVSFQLDPALLALCTPLDPVASIHLGTWFTGFTNTNLQVTSEGNGAYTVDVVLLGTPCGIAGGGTLFTMDLKSVAGDGLGAITVTSVKARDCVNTPIPVMAGPQAYVHIHNAPIPISPPVLPNGLTGVPYSQTLTAADGEPPYSFALTAGALPPGLTLAANGQLTGTPTATGTFNFTVGVTDAGGCPGSRAYSLTISCAPIAVSPGTLPDAQVGVAYSQFVSASGALAPITWSVSAGSLPPGLALTASTGEISGTPPVSGFGVFTLTATDAAGCTGSESYTLAAFTDPAASNVAARTAGLCLSAAHPCVGVPFVYARGESAPARGVSVTFQLDASLLSLCTPLNPAASIHSGSWLAGYANQAMQITDHGAGAYTVDLALLGTPCGPDTGGVLFNVDVKSVAGDGLGSITVTAAQSRDCDGQPLPVVPGAVAELAVSHAAPPAINDLAASQVTAGNDGSGRTGITVTWSTAVAGRVSLYRAPFGSYPEYDDGGGVAPDSALAPGAPWVLVSASAVPGLTDHPPVRGFWHYVAFLADSCDNLSAVSNRSGGALDYHLGDVSNGLTPGTGDNRVALEDVSLLGAHYGISGAALVTDGVAYLDVGPTTNGQPTSRPLTDDVLDIEDLILFALNFQTVSAPPTAAGPALDGRGPALGSGESFEVEAPSLVEPGDEFTVTLRLGAGGRMQGFSARLEWDPTVARPIATQSAGWIESQGGLVLAPRPGTVDAALFGRRARGIEGAGEVARVRFRALREADPALRIGEVIARDAANRPLAPASLTRETRALAPARTTLLSPAPNPARGSSLVSFALARAADADLALYGVDGRRVRTLAHGAHEAGVHRIPWSGDDDSHRALAPGIYWLRLEAAGERFTRRIVLLR